MRNSIHASINIVLRKSYAKLTRTEISEDHSYLHTVMFLFIVCDMFSSIASLNVHYRLQRPRSTAPTLSSFTPPFFPPSCRRGCSIRSRSLGCRWGRLCMCADSKHRRLMRRSPPECRHSSTGRCELQVCKKLSATATLR